MMQDSVTLARIVLYDIHLKMPAYKFRIVGEFVISNDGEISDQAHINRILGYFIGIHPSYEYELLNAFLIDNVLFSQIYYDKTFWTSYWCLIPAYYGYHSVLSDNEMEYKITEFYIKPVSGIGIFKHRPRKPYISL